MLRFGSPENKKKGYLREKKKKYREKKMGVALKNVKGKEERRKKRVYKHEDAWERKAVNTISSLINYFIFKF